MPENDIGVNNNLEEHDFFDTVLSREDIWQRLQKTQRAVIIYGTGNGADKVLNELDRLNVRVHGVMASDDFVRGQRFRGYTVQKLSDFEQQYPNPIILIAFGTQRNEVMNQILSVAEKHTVLCADVPVYGDHIFNRRFCHEHLSELRQAYHLLGDELSRQTYRNVIQFKLTGELQYLTESFSPKDEAFIHLMKLNHHESYLDLGAYRGDTIDELLHYTDGDYQHITALEPDKKTFLKLKEHTAGLAKRQLFNMGIWDQDTDLKFNASQGRGSSIASSGSESLPVTTIDTLYRKRKVSYIKMDVEGAEEKAITGGKAVIVRDKPKMNIALYHRSEDIFSIPLLLHSLVPDYSFYIRQHPHIPAWDLNLYCTLQT